MQSLITSIRSIGLLTIALTVALAANFAYGQWANPPADAPNQNVTAPVNVSDEDQEKVGNFAAWNLSAQNKVKTSTSTGEMWSPKYCDGEGENCWDPSTGVSPGGGGGGLKTRMVYVETAKRTALADQKCKDRGYDGFFSGMDNDHGPENIFCYVYGRPLPQVCNAYGCADNPEDLLKCNAYGCIKVGEPWSSCTADSC